MNFFVADPEWGWWIILYFYVGGIAAGAYFIATLIELFGSEADRDVSRVGYWIAFPLIVVCGFFLVVDLHRPERFWHMLFKSEVVTEAFREGWPFSARSWSLIWHAPLMKFWSPMSIGSWALSAFGLCAFLSFLVVWPDRWVGRLLHRTMIARILAIVGSLMGFFIAAYTGALVTATNQPIWSESVWIAPLFLTSAASTGIATMILLLPWRGRASRDAVDRLERADLWALGLELAVFAIFLASLGGYFIALVHTWGGIVFVAGTLLLGLLAPLAIHLRMGLEGRRAEVAAASLALLGGFLLRYGLLTAAPEILRAGPAVATRFGPEDARPRGGGPGADPGNKAKPIVPRSKVYPNE